MPRSLLLVAISACFLETVACTVKATVSQPEAVVVTRDLSNFIRARDIVRAGGDPIITYQREYFDKGSQGLKDMFELRIKSVENFAAAIEKFPDSHESLVDVERNAPALTENVEMVFANYRRIYPAANLPPVYFVVAGMTSGGTVSDNGLLIGTAAVIYAFGEDALVPVVAHELAHFQQPNAEGKDSLSAVGGDANTLLGQAINEGAADFFGELTSGRRMNAKAHEYGLAHEAELWSEFKEVMLGGKLMPWMNGRSNEGVWAERPRDLGYFIGYRIVQSYYDKAADKQTAAAKIFNIDDFEAFLEASGYSARFGDK